MNNRLRFLLRLLLLLPMLALLAAGCRPSPLRKTLLCAESVMEEHPDSAYALLAPLKVDSSAPKRDRALYALLLTQARYKIGYDDTIAAGLPFAISYYENRKSEGLHTGKARLMAALIACNRGEYSTAILHCMAALDIEDFASNPFYNAQASRCLGDAFYNIMNYPMCLKWYRQARLKYREAVKDHYERHADIDVGRALVCNGLYADALAVSDTVMSNATQEQDTSMMVSALRIAGKSYFDRNEFEAAAGCYRRASELDGDYLDTHALVNYGESLLRTGRRKEAIAVDSVLMRRGVPENWVHYLLLSREHGVDTCGAMLLHFMEEQNDIIASQMNEQVTLMLQERSVRIQREKEMQLITMRRNIILIAIVAGLLLFLIVRLHLEHKKTIRAREEAFTDKVRLLCNELMEARKDLEKKEHDMLMEIDIRHKEMEVRKQDIGSKQEEIGLLQRRLGDMQVSMDNIKNGQSVLLDFMTRMNALGEKEMPGGSCNGKSGIGKSHFVDMLEDSELTGQLRILADELHDNVMTDFMSDFSGITMKDQLLFLYCTLGLTIPSLSLIFGVKREMIYNRRSAIRKLVNQSVVPKKEKYLQFLSDRRKNGAK